MKLFSPFVYFVSFVFEKSRLVKTIKIKSSPFIPGKSRPVMIKYP